MSKCGRAGFFAILIPLLTFAFLCFSPPLSHSQTFKIYTEEFPPYNYTKGDEIVGISTEIVREILKRLNHPDNIEVFSWSRAYTLVQKNDNLILFSTTRTPFREDLFKWVGPLVPNNTVFFGRKGSGISIKSLDDAKKVGRIGVYMDDFGELLLKDKGFTNLHSVPDNRENVKKLVEGQIDLWIINALTGKHMARQQGFAERLEIVYEVQRDFMYMAFSKTTPDAVIQKWQAVLDEIKADGTYAQVFSNWIMFSFTEVFKPATKLDLTDAEKAWLQQHQVIRIAPDPDFAPFQFRNSRGQSLGIANDYLALIGKKLGVTFESVKTESWNEALNMVKKKKADMVAVAAETDERKKYMLFTHPYVEFPDVVVVRKSSPRVSSIEQFYGKTLASIAGFAVNDFLKKNHPEINIVMKQDTASLLKSVSIGEVDAAVLNLATISHTVEKEKITNLRVAIDTGFSYKLTFATRKDWPILNSVLQKAVDGVSEEERRDIMRNWIAFSYGRKTGPQTKLVNLTEDEKDWLKRHPVLKVAPDPDWPPIEFFNKDGSYSGMTAEYISLIEEKLGVDIKVVRLKSWEDVLRAAKEREIDFTAGTVATPGRKEYLLFTEPYLHLPAVIIVSDKVEGNLAMEDLKGKKVSVVSGFSSQEYMKENYPGIMLDPVFNTLEGLRKVAFGKSYALVANVATAAYLMEKEVITNLRIAGESGYTFNLAMASRTDWPILNRILEKSLSAITDTERKEIFRKWISISEKPWITIKQLVITLSIIFGVLFVIGIVVWNRELKRKVELRTKELRTSEEKFKNLYSTAMVGLFRTSIDGTKIYSANEALAKLFAFDSAEQLLEGFAPKDLYVNPSQREELISKLKRDGKVENFEFLAKCKDGVTRNLVLSATLYEENGYLEGAMIDITERKKTEEALKSNASQIRLLKEIAVASNETNTVDEAMLICLKKVCEYTNWEVGHVYIPNPDGLLVSSGLWNVDDPTKFKVFQSKTKTLTFERGVGLPGRVYESAKPDWISDLSEDKNFSRAQGGEDIVVRAGFAFPVLEGKTVVAVAEFYTTEITRRDDSLMETIKHVGTQLGRVTERRKAERELEIAKEKSEEANVAKSQFLSSMSHELRTPLNSIIGFAQLLETDDKESLTLSQMENVQQVIKSGNHLLTLINEVLDLAKIESGNITISMEPVAVCELIDEAILSVKSLAAKCGISVTSETDGCDDIFVRADKTRLKQVLLNLISNGIKYNRRPGTVSVYVEFPKKERVAFMVEDSGIGIPEERMKDLYKPFNRLGAEAMDIEGTGIGLTITKQIVELMNGEIEVESIVGKGTKFWVILDIADKPELVNDVQDFDQNIAVSQIEAKTVLCVEDNMANMRLIQKIIERRPGIKFITAPDAELGIKMARAGKPDLILMDINLPDMDGFEALKQLKSDPRTSEIPVVAVSANAMDGEAKRGKKAGFSDYITKPINVSLFLSAIDNAFTKKDSIPQNAKK